MKNKFKNRAVSLSLCAAGLMLICAGCGTQANLAGLGVSINVAQKGQAAALNLSAGTNSITVGGSYQQGTNNISSTVTVPE
jgi:hypothetical protein